MFSQFLVTANEREKDIGRKGKQSTEGWNSKTRKETIEE